MADWLLKTEPDDYAFADLVRDKACTWDGVANALALKHLREIKKGDRVLIYHTGKEKAAVGLATVTKSAYADPKQDDPKLAVVDLKPGKALKSPVTLAAMKADPAFEGWDLLRLGRLSVVPVPAAVWKRIEHLAEAAE